MSEGQVFLALPGSVLVDVLGGSNRAGIIVGGAILDDYLTHRIKSRLLENTNDTDPLFAPDRPIGSFGAKIELGRRMGLFGEAEYSRFNMLRRIRNDFAHHSQIGRSTVDRARSLTETLFESSLPNFFTISWEARDYPNPLSVGEGDPCRDILFLLRIALVFWISWFRPDSPGKPGEQFLVIFYGPGGRLLIEGEHSWDFTIVTDDNPGHLQKNS